MMIPEMIGPIRVYKGMEVNILGIDGRLDVPDKQLQYLEFGIASFHAGGAGIVAGTESENTEVYIKTLQNPWIDTIGHADEPRVPCDLEAVVLEALGLLCIVQDRLYESDFDRFLQLEQSMKK